MPDVIRCDRADLHHYDTIAFGYCKTCRRDRMHAYHKRVSFEKLPSRILVGKIHMHRKACRPSVMGYGYLNKLPADHLKRILSVLLAFRIGSHTFKSYFFTVFPNAVHILFIKAAYLFFIHFPLRNNTFLPRKLCYIVKNYNIRMITF